MEFNISNLIMSITADNQNPISLVNISAIFSALATISMAVFSHKAIKKSEEQTNELKRQFNEENRANIVINFEVVDGLLWLSIQNLGRKIANDIKIEVEETFIEKCASSQAKDLLKELKNSCFNLGIGQKFLTAPFSGSDIKNSELKEMTVNFSYKDSQKSYQINNYKLYLANYMWVVTIVDKNETLLKDQINQLKNISDNIKLINENKTK